MPDKVVPKTAVILPLIILTISSGAAFGFGMNKVRDFDFHWRILETENFDIYYYQDEEFIIEFVAEVAEEAYDQAKEMLEFEPKSVVPLIIYKSRREMEQTNILDTIGEEIGGFAEIMHRRIVLPYSGSQEEFAKTLTHEITHIFTFDMFFANFGSLLAGSIISPPMWAMEGIPEYVSGRWTPEGIQVLRDAVINDNLYHLEDLKDFYYLPPWDIYLAYQLGHSALDYMAETYGSDAVATFLREMRRVHTRSADEALKHAFNIGLDEFNEDWQLWLKRKYLPDIAEKDTLKEYSNRLTSYEELKDGISYFRPSFSASGDLIACMSNRGRFVDILLINSSDGTIFENLTEGWAYKKYDYFVYSGSGVDFSADGNFVTFAAKKGTRDRIFIVGVIKRKIVRRLDIPYSDLESPAFSPDGRYIAFSGLEGQYRDIYIYDLTTGKTTRLTDDPESDTYPDWSPDGEWIVFQSESIDGTHLKMISADGSTEKQLTFTPEVEDTSPSFSPDGKEIIFVSTRNTSIKNIFTYDLTTHMVTQRSNLLVGAEDPKYSPHGDMVAYSGIEKGLYQICVLDTPLPVFFEPVLEQAPEGGVVTPLHPLTTSEEVAEETRKYGIKLTTDYVASNFSYTTGGVFRNYTEIALSDMLSNHRFAFLFDLTSVSSFEDIDAAFQYFNLSHRFNYGVTLLTWRDYYRINERRYWERLSGVDFYFAYPFSRTMRVEIIPFSYLRKYDFIDEPTEMTLYLLGADFSFLRDTALWGYYHPTSGSRMQFTVEQTIPVAENFLYYTDLVLDARKYIYLSQRNSLATRLVLGASLGRDPQHFYLGGGFSLRGYPFNAFYGSRVFLANVELRFPIIDAIFTSIPGFAIGGFRGLFFFDIGSAWSPVDDGGVKWSGGEKFDFWDTEGGFHLVDAKASFGTGLRWALGYFDLRIDWAWTTDFQSINKKPYVHFTIGPEF